MEDVIEYNGYKINIIQDVDSYNPRVDDNLGKITYNPSGSYILGDTPMDGEDVNKIENNTREYISIRVFAYIHSGTTIKASDSNPFHCSWDSGQSGIIFISKEKARKELGYIRLTKSKVEKIRNYLVSEVETFNNYITGEVYGYDIEDSEGEEIDSCYGFYGDDHRKSGLLETAEGLIDSLLDKEIF